MPTDVWTFDEFRHAGEEHLDPAYVAEYDRKAARPSAHRRHLAPGWHAAAPRPGLLLRARSGADRHCGLVSRRRQQTRRGLDTRRIADASAPGIQHIHLAAGTDVDPCWFRDS